MFLCAYVSRKNHFYSEKFFSKKSIYGVVNWVSRGVFLGWLVGWLVARFAGGLKKILEKYLDKMNAETEFSVQKNPGTPPEKNLRKLFDKKIFLVRAILQIFADSHYIYNGRHRSSKVGARVKNFQKFSKIFFGLKMI